MTRFMKRKDSPHVIGFNQNLIGDDRFEVLPEGFDIKGYQEEMKRTKGKPEFPIDHFFPDRIKKATETIDMETKSSIPAIPIQVQFNTEIPKDEDITEEDTTVEEEVFVGVDDFERKNLTDEDIENDNDSIDETIESVIPETSIKKPPFQMNNIKLMEYMETTFGVTIKDGMHRHELLRLLKALQENYNEENDDEE